MKKLYFLLLIYLLSFPVVAVADPQSDFFLKELDEKLKDRDFFISGRWDKVDSLRKIRARFPRHSLKFLLATERIGDEFAGFNNDSSIRYYSNGLQLALSLGNDSMADVFRIKEAACMPLSGFVNEAVDRMSAIDTAALSRNMYMLYLITSRQMYSYISSYYNRSPDVMAYYSDKALEYQKMIIDNADTGSVIYLLNLGEYLFAHRRYAEAEKVLYSLLDKVPENSNLYARACHIMSSIAAAKGDSDKRVEFLAKSASSDLESATLEVVSLQELGNYLYNHGDIGRAYSYLQTALENAVTCNAQLRMVEVSSALPIIAQAQSRNERDQRRKLTILVIIMSCLMVAIAVNMMYIYRERNRIANLKAHLEQANRTKDVYLGQFMNMCSTYMDRLISFNKVVNRKLSAGKTDDLFKLTKSGKFVEEQAQEFYEAFDNAFLHIYPDFVKEVNSLLIPGQEITLEEGETLNTNLRILAFIRLGMDDAAKIAQILNYSVNTIYSYRNRLRNRAKNRDTFEEDIRRISGI